PAECFRDVLGVLAPDAAPHEQCLAVLPLACLLVEVARCGGDGEVRDRRAGRGETQLRIGGEVTDDSDDGVSGHRSSSLRRTPRNGNHGYVGCPCGRPWCAAQSLAATADVRG